jgi:hypothetical protein
MNDGEWRHAGGPCPRFRELLGPVGHSPPELGGVDPEFPMISTVMSRIPP